MSTYTRELVEQLLPAAWDSEFAFGMANPAAPNPDMPKATTDNAQGSTLYAHIADIHTGWRAAPLTGTERRTLIMRYGLDWPQTAIARHEHVRQPTASERITRGVGRIVDTLNGDSSKEADQNS